MPIQQLRSEIIAISSMCSAPWAEVEVIAKAATTATLRDERDRAQPAPLAKRSTCQSLTRPGPAHRLVSRRSRGLTIRSYGTGLPA